MFWVEVMPTLLLLTAGQGALQANAFHECRHGRGYFKARSVLS